MTPEISHDITKCYLMTVLQAHYQSSYSNQAGVQVFAATFTLVEPTQPG